MIEQTVLVLPGYMNSGEGHWQTRWESLHAGFERVQMPDWDHPVRDAWCRTLEAAVAASTRPVAFAAHSLGCLTVAFWAAQYASAGSFAKVAGALLWRCPIRLEAGFHRMRAAFRRYRWPRCRSPVWWSPVRTIRMAAFPSRRNVPRRGAAAGAKSVRAGISMPIAGSAIGTKGSSGWRRSRRVQWAGEGRRVELSVAARLEVSRRSRRVQGQPQLWPGEPACRRALLDTSPVSQITDCPRNCAMRSSSYPSTSRRMLSVCSPSVGG
jgi:hypothetical protein